MENNSTLKAIAGLITLIVLCFTMCTTCGDDKSEENKDPNAQFYGAYTLYDAYNHKIIITVYRKDPFSQALFGDCQRLCQSRSKKQL